MCYFANIHAKLLKETWIGEKNVKLFQNFGANIGNMTNIIREFYH